MTYRDKKDLVYVCSPLGAKTPEEVRANMVRAREYMDIVSKKYNCRAIAPHAILPEYLDDCVPEERALGLKFGLDLLRICKMVVVCGYIISDGNQINDDEYMNLSGEIEREQISLEDSIRELKRNVKMITAMKKEKESAVNTYKELGKIKKIDRDVVDRFIEKIIISKEGRVEIKWNFENIFSS